MFEPDSRVVLMDQLRPPAGFRLAAAVATTFTLHLPTALVAPLAFAPYDLRTRDDPIAALEAVRACADRVDIFCQAGQIAVPQQASDLMAFLEPMVHPVGRPRPGHLFHPKVWFLRYRAPGLPDAYRLICSTRNLADSHAWDAVVILDGAEQPRRDDANPPLAAFLRQLPHWAVAPLPDDRRTRLEDLADRSERIIWRAPDQVNDVRFHAFGVPGLTPQPDFGGYRHLVISPFLDTAGLGRVTGGNRRDVALVSRPEALDALEPGLLGQLARPGDEAVFVLDPLTGLDTDALEAATPVTDDQPPAQRPGGRTDSRGHGTGNGELAGLHAKITVVERHRGETHLFLGSANATSAAYGGNVEFVVELVGRAKDLGVETMMRRPDDPRPAPTLRTLLEPYAPGGDLPLPEEDEARHRLENLLRTLAAVPFRIAVLDGPQRYRLHLTSERVLGIPDGHTVQLALLTQPGISSTLTEPGACAADFEADLPDITPFVTMRVSDATGLTLSTVVYAPLDNDPPNRLDEVLARQVDTPEKFLRFLALLLGLADPAALWVETPDGRPAGAWGASIGGSTGVFELLVQALAEHPEALMDLDRLVTRLRETERGRTALPDGFDQLWTTVTAALGSLASADAGKSTGDRT